MTAPKVRTLAVTYGSFGIGGTTEYLIDSWMYNEDSFTKASLEVTFTTAIATTDAAFAASCAAVEAAFRKPRQDLTVVQNSATTLSLKQSDSTGLDSEPTITKVRDSVVNTGRSRMYRAVITFGRPADNVATPGLRYSSTHVEYLPNGKRKVTISGTWTAIGAVDAFAHYTANVDAFCASRLTLVLGAAVSEKTGEPRVELNSTNKTLEFSRTYQELIYPDAGKSAPTLDDPEITLQSLRISRESVGPGDTTSTPAESNAGANPAAPAASSSGSTVAGPGFSGGGGGGGSGSGGAVNVHRLIRITVNYDAWIKTGVNPKDKYTGVIYDWLIQQADLFNDWGQMALVSQALDPDDLNENKVTARLEFLAQGPARVVSYKVTTADPSNYGSVLVQVWTGNPYSKYKYQGPATRQRIITEEKRVIGAATERDLFGNYTTANIAGMSAVIMSKDPSSTPQTLGVGNSSKKMDVTDVTVRTVIEFYEPVASSSAQSNATIAAPGGAAGPAAQSPPVVATQ